MKHIDKGIISFAIFFLFPSLIDAQVVAEADSSFTIEKESQIQVAFRKLNPDELLGGVSAVNIAELIDKSYHTYSLEDLQGFIGGWNGNSMWGMGDYLVLVDGIPRDANNVLPTEIEQISFLKGASAVVLYGSRAAKGVICITTKRGKIEPLKIEVRANSGIRAAKSYPKYLGSAEYMTLYNEALENDGLDPLYSDEEIYNYGSGSNPYRYPDVDFYSPEYIRPYYNRSDITTEISGGNENARYYTNIGYYYQGDVYNFGQADNNNISRLNVRGNVDLDLNESISAFINTNATFYNSRSANASGNDYWTSAATFRPNRVSPLIPISYIDPNDVNSLGLMSNNTNIIDEMYFLGGTQVDQTNVFADYHAGGFSKWTSRQFQFDTGLDFELRKLLKGLSFHTQFAVDYATSYNTSYNNTYAVYTPSWYNYNGDDVITSLTKEGNDERSGVQNINGSASRQTLAFSGYFNYQRSFNGHNLSAMLIAYGYQQTQSEIYHRTNNANLGLQLAYNYKGRYYLDFGAAEVHTTKLAEGHRTALSPSLTLAWRPSNESFLENSEVIDNLVLSASGSILNTDLDIEEYYMYEANFNQSEGAWWGWYDGAVERSTNSLRGGNEDLTFIKRKELSANLMASLWNNLVSVNASWFMNTMEGLIIEPSTTLFPSYFFTYYPDASFVPFINFNSDYRTGFDFSLNVNKQFGDFAFSLGLAATYYTTEASIRDENYEFDYQNRQGKSLDGIWGLESDGLFQTQEEIDEAPEQLFGGTVSPGDIKYIDQNEDDVIDDLDVIYLAKGGWFGAPLSGGMNITAGWKNLKIFALFTGSYGSYGMKNSSYYWIYGDGKYSEVVRDRWTEETMETATYPRLTTKTGSNNFRNSDYWLYKTDRINLARLQLSYTLPSNILGDFVIKDLSVYINGSNLMTFSKESEHLDMNIGSAPQTRFYNMGVKALF